MKKIPAVILALCLAFAMTACVKAVEETTAAAEFETEDGESGIEIQVSTKAETESTMEEQTAEKQTSEATTEATRSVTDITKESPVDLTPILGKEDLSEYKDEYVSFNGGMVTEQYDSEGEERMFLYRQDGSGSDGDDLYFNVMFTGKSYTFVVDTDICDKDSEVYQTVKNFRSGDIVDIEAITSSDGSASKVVSVEVK